MTKPKSELDELQDLQKKSQKMRQKQEVSDAGPPPAEAAEAVELPTAGSGEGGEPLEDQRAFVGGLTGQVEDFISELEEAAAERPALALLAAFGIGIFVGQLLSRR